MKSASERSLSDHRVVDRDQWEAERQKLLELEKQMTRQRDQLARARRNLPWELIEKNYTFDTVDGRRTLAQLFDGRRQLMVHHFMFAPGWEDGCTSCSFMADHIDGPNVHLSHRDVTYVAISRAPLAQIEAFRRRMGWRFKWVSSFDSDFNYDFKVSMTPEEAQGKSQLHNPDRPQEERPAISVFYKDKDSSVYRTYSTYGRGVEVVMGTYNLLDLTPEGRSEDENSPYKMKWLHLHDRYEDTAG